VKARHGGPAPGLREALVNVSKFNTDTTKAVRIILVLVRTDVDMLFNPCIAL
jgi:hypothetical protein